MITQKNYGILVSGRPEIFEDFQAAEKFLLADFKIVSSVLELCNELAASEKGVNLVVFDCAMFFENTAMSVFDVTNLVQNFAKASNSHVVPNLSAYVDSKSDPKQVEQLLDTEIKGFVPGVQLFGLDDIIVALAELLNNRIYLPRKLVDYYLHPQKNKIGNKTTVVLTRRQAQILNLITTRGASNKVIARTLKISESTVKLHISAILKKYGVRNRTRLALCSLGNGRL